MKRVIFALNLASALTALAAAYFWFRSAANDPPPMVAYWDKALSTDPLFQALQTGARDNRFAATFAGISAVTMAAATLAQLRQR